MLKTVIKPAIRYSEAFKMQVVKELETGLINIDQIRRKYGLASCHSIRRWIARYGNGSIGKVIRVQKPEETDELTKLKKRVRQLETLLADTNVDLAIERAYTKIACERAGIKDVDEFKKKAAGQQDMPQ